MQKIEEESSSQYSQPKPNQRKSSNSSFKLDKYDQKKYKRENNDNT